MIEFVNAKINIGLHIVGKREDGYHLLETVFYPVGVNNGKPQNPEPFCDIIELTDRQETDPEGYEEHGVRYLFSGKQVDCPPEKNLVVKGARALFAYIEEKCGADALGKLTESTVRMVKKLPDGAGMGGGSADAVAVMKLLRGKIAKETGIEVSDSEMESIAVKVGADCPVFVKNRPAYAEGIGEKLQEMESFLKGMWLVVVKPEVSISTKEAFAGVTPREREEKLPELIEMPMKEWRYVIKNDFEESLFPKYPELKQIKEYLYEAGAEYASMTGSGAALYGIFCDENVARKAMKGAVVQAHAPAANPNEIHVSYRALIRL